MKIPSVGWAFFALAVIVLIGYVLNRGIYIGSEVRRSPYGYAKHCRYLHFAGAKDGLAFFSEPTPEEADKKVCGMFED